MMFHVVLLSSTPATPQVPVSQKKNIEDILRFCHTENLLLMADEVYQENVYVKEKPFVSFKKKLRSMPEEFRGVELISFHSTSKGLYGECGKRGGYFELTNIDPEVKTQIYKMLSVNLCPNITGQITLDLLVAPPRPGDPSFPQYQEEKSAIYNSLKFRAALVADKLNALPGIKCQPAEGALYTFPNITLPNKAIKKAKELNMEADMLYCLELLDETGLCVVPGSGFGQKEGEHHFRTTFLPKEELLKEVLDAFAKFHIKFLKLYS